ncbi:MAG: endonuclease V [Elusimicrobiales bacterium]|nr:endonuclease V [Elusimicrobiales bacterium]
MKTSPLHGWEISPADAIQLQKELVPLVRERRLARPPRVIAGADCGLDVENVRIHAGVILFSYPELKELERRRATLPLAFSYVSGLLSFRECPALLKAFSLLSRKPDVVMFDGQGRAHPRRLGLACHMGLWLGIPSFGCAKSRLTGRFVPPGRKRGSVSPLTDKGETIGAVVRTRDGCNPVFVSAGHLITLAEAVEITLHCAVAGRIPLPTREADRWLRG